MRQLNALVGVPFVAVVLLATAVFSGASASAETSPVAKDDFYTTSQGVPLKVDAPGYLANDTPGLTYTLRTRAKHGTVNFMTVPGGFTYEATDPSFIGQDAFTYCLAADFGGGACVSADATVNIDVSASAAVPDQYDVSAGAPLVVATPGVMANDRPTAGLQPTWLTKPTHGTFTPSPFVGAFTYSLTDPAYAGFDSFQYCLATFGGGPCVSNPASVVVRVGGGPDVVRVGGADRFAVAAGVAQRVHPTGPVDVMVASGEGYADALSAAPAAVKSGAALLLATRGSLPAATAGEISRLKPMKVTIVGGPAAISEAVVGEITKLLPAGAKVERIGGADRFVVSRAIAAQYFGTSPHSFVTTGLNFPDALAAGAAAGSGGEPVVLVNGQAPSVDAETKAALSKLATSRVAVVGGPKSVSTGIETSLKALASVDRLAGADRYETAVSVAKAVFPAADTVYFATGVDFPDALVGSVAAGTGKSPIYTVPGSCVPQAVLDDMARIGAQYVVLLGGPKALSPEVEKLTPCV